MFRKAVVLFALAALVVLAGCTKKEAATSGLAAPDFTLQDLSGRDVRLSSLKGKVVVVEFWATWCGPCQASIPGMERLYRTYGPKGFVVLAVSLDEGGWDAVRAFAKQEGITYPVLKGTDDVMAEYRVRAIPTMFLLNRSGKITAHLEGMGYEERLEKDLRALL